MLLIYSENINHINNKNHKIIRNCPKPSNTRQDHKKSTKCSSTSRARLELCLVSISYDIK